VKLVSRSVVSVFLLLAVFLPACGADSGASETRDSQQQLGSSAPSALNWATLKAGSVPPELQIGDSRIDGESLRAALLDLHQAYDVWGPSTLAWHLLDGGLAATALLHDRFAEQSATARAEAEAAAQRLRDGEGFYAILQEAGGDPAPVMRQASPAALGASTSAAVAGLEPGAWAGPLRTIDGWEIVLLEARAEGPRSRSGVVVRSITYPIASESEQTQARADWATLPLAGDPALLRSLPRSLVRGRVAADESL
jgi:parvulin-like peptidyl-prolyl cis-trans isomerase-like protein